MMKLLLSLLLLASPAFALDTEGEIQAIKKQLAPFSVLKGRFEQSKQIKILKKPLKSQGSFVLAKDKGLIWASTKPLASTLRITKDAIAQLKDGKAKVFVSTQEQPGLRVIGKVLFAVFSADVEELRRHFEFSSASAPSGQPWSAQLKPKDLSVAKAIRSIEIRGTSTVSSLTLQEANGDSTLILFSGVSSKQPISKTEEALFE